MTGNSVCKLADIEVVVDSLFLLRLAQAYSGHTGQSLATIGTYATNDGEIFARFERGGDCTTQRAKRLGWWFSENWPDDLEWPSDIPRPTAAAKAKA